MVSINAITTLVIDLIGRGGSSSTSSSRGEIEDLDLALETQVSRIFEGRDSSSSSAADQNLPCTDQLEGILRKRLSVAVDQSDFPTILRFVKFLKPPEEGLYVILSYLKNNTSTRSRNQLEEILRRRLSAAVDRWDHPTILLLVKLLKPLGLEEEGLEVFLSYLKTVVSTRSRKEFEILERHLHSNSEVQYAVACLKNILVDIVSAIEENVEIVRYLCGENGTARAIRELHQVCDSEVTCILEMLHLKLNEIDSEYSHLYSDRSRWLGHFPFEEHLEASGLGDSLFGLGAFGIEEPLPELGEVELYLEEMLLLTQLLEDHVETMSSKIWSLIVDPQLRRLATDAVWPKKFDNIFWLTAYIQLECLIMEKNVRKAIRIDEYMPDNRMSTMVGDVFYVLWESCSRALSTSDISFVTPVVRYSVDLLKSLYTDALKPNVLENTGVQQNAIALNNWEVSHQHALDFCHWIEKQIKQGRNMCAGSLDGIRNHFEDGLGDRIRGLADLVESEINTVFESFTRGSDGEAIYDDANPSWVPMVIDVLETNVAPLKPLISPRNYEKIVNAVIGSIVQWLRDNIFILNFRNGGHKQLPRDIITMACYLSGMSTEWPVEDPVGIEMNLLDATVIPQIEKVLESAKTIDSMVKQYMMSLTHRYRS